MTNKQKRFCEEYLVDLIGKHIGMFKSDSDADAPALEKLDKILAEVRTDADREAKAVHRRGK